MTHRGTPSRALRVAALARVEGEGAMRVHVRDGRVDQVALEIYEPPRFFEAMLRGRHASEAPDITARICGICPVAYQISACLAIEAAAGVEVPTAVTDLRRLLYCGEWIESHALHIFFLHAPDFFDLDGVVELAALDRPLVERGLRIKRAGNAIVEVVGGRPIHPVNVRVGGFYRAPSPARLAELRDELRWARDAACATTQWAGTLEFPDFTPTHDYLALRQPGRYPIDGGHVVTSTGQEFPVADFEAHVVEEQVAHSNALHARLDGRRGFLVGPLARYNLNFDRLTPLARETARAGGLGPACHNPFQSIVVRGVEMVQALDDALAIIERYAPPDPPACEVPARPGRGHGATEAPRGVLYHRYDIDSEGTIASARIVPPTAQNQAAIEDDLAAFVAPRLSLDDVALTHQCEQAIRNYDPCISCATHFLTVDVDRR